MKRSIVAVVACLLFLPSVCRAKTTCPWINEATAYGVLGGMADSPMNTVEVTPAMCSFSYKDASITRQLVVTVEVAKNPVETLKSFESRCGKNSSPLSAIGNEAVTCPSTGKKHVYGEQVIGRVRDSVFTIQLNFGDNSSPVLSKDVLDEKTRIVAEQVAGNLF